MRWYIKHIIIYGLHKEKRIVTFEPGINIILGDVKTGKTSLIYIVDYCLGPQNVPFLIKLFVSLLNGMLL